MSINVTLVMIDERSCSMTFRLMCKVTLTYLFKRDCQCVNVTIAYQLGVNRFRGNFFQADR